MTLCGVKTKLDNGRREMEAVKNLLDVFEAEAAIGDLVKLRADGEIGRAHV